MSGFIIGLAVVEFIALVVVAILYKGRALEALGISAVLWAAAWFATSAGLAVFYGVGHLLGRAPAVALCIAFANLGVFRLAEWVDTKYGNPAK